MKSGRPGIVHKPRHSHATTVKQILPRRRRGTVTAPADSVVAEASRRLASEDIGSLVIIDPMGKPVGVLSERDIARACADPATDIAHRPVTEVMTAEVLTCEPDDTIQTVKTIMTANNIRHLPIKKNGIIVGMLSMRDVANYEAAVLDARNQLLEETERQFRNAIETSPNGIYVQITGKIIYANPAMAALVGTATPADLVGKDSLDFLHPDCRDRIQARRENINRHSETTNTFIDVTFVRSDGSSFDAEITGRAALWDSEQGIMVSVRDITHRKQAEATLRAAKEEAELSSRAKSEFLANMSHEFRTPLNAIIGFSQILAQGTRDPAEGEEHRGYAKHIHDAGKHLLSLINDVLDTARIDSGRVDLKEENIKISDVIEASVIMVRERARTNGITLTTEIADDATPPIHADPRRLKQILINLLWNAIKFTQTGGTITVKAWYTADSGYVVQCIDTGIGMAMADVPKAMGRFQQIDSALNRQHEGTGLGLPLTKSLVELHGGSMDLQSVMEKGTTVTIRLPAERRVKVAA